MTVKAKKVGPKGYPNGGYPRRLSDGESHFAQCPLRGDHFETDTSLITHFASGQFADGHFETVASLNFHFAPKKINKKTNEY